MTEEGADDERGLRMTEGEVNYFFLATNINHLYNHPY